MKWALWALFLVVASALRLDEQTPVTKVLKLLQDMQKKLEAEGEADAEVDEKMKCWCKETEQSKEESLAAGKSRVALLGGEIETSGAEGLRLASELSGHENDLASSQNSLAAAEAQRQKQRDSFQAETKELEESLGGVDAALDSLQSKSSLISKAQVLQLIEDLQIQRRGRKLAQQAFLGTSPATGEVIGVLSSMKDTMATNLNKTRREELESVESYEGLHKAKLQEISATEEAILSKKAQKAKADTNAARAKKDLEDAQASLLVDKQFLEDAKAKCAAEAAAYAERAQKRSEEVAGCTKAVAILSDDSARDTLRRSFSFLQLQHGERSAAARLLAETAQKFQDTRLADVAQRVRNEAFDKVKEEIDGLVGQLKKVQEEEVAAKDSCLERLHDNTLDSTKSGNGKVQAESKVAGLQDVVLQHERSLKSLTSEIEDLKTELKDAETDLQLRVNESSKIIKDQKHTQVLLQRAMEVLEPIVRQEANAVMLLLQQIIGDAKIMQTKAETEQGAAQKDFEQFKNDALVAISTKEQGLVDLGLEKSETQAELLDAKAKATDLQKELALLGETKSALKEECDVLITNFGLRQDAREEEMDALKTAKNLLSGMQQ